MRQRRALRNIPVRATLISVVAYLAVGAEKRLDGGRGRGRGGANRVCVGVFVLPFVLLKAVQDHIGNHCLIAAVKRKS